jgi:hypothetical protein
MVVSRGARISLEFEEENAGFYAYLEMFRRGSGKWSKRANINMRYGNDKSYRTEMLRNNRVHANLTLRAAQDICEADDLCVGMAHRRSDNTWHFKTKWSDQYNRADPDVDSYRRDDAIERVITSGVRLSKGKYDFSVPRTDRWGHLYQGDVYFRMWSRENPEATARFPAEEDQYVTIKGDKECQAHTDCPWDEYCDKGNGCYKWYGCQKTQTHNGPIDGACPTKAKYRSATIETFHPTENQEFSSADKIVLEWDFNRAAGEKMNAWLVRAVRQECFAEGKPASVCNRIKNRIVSEVFTAQPTNARRFEYSPDRMTDTGLYYIGYSAHSSPRFYSSAPFKAEDGRVVIGQAVFHIERAKCPSHESCDGHAYCQADGLCATCEACRHRRNAFDGVCPLHCLNNVGPEVAGAAIPEKKPEFFEVNDVTYEGCRR